MCIVENLISAFCVCVCECVCFGLEVLMWSQSRTTTKLVAITTRRVKTNFGEKLRVEIRCAEASGQ